MRITLRVIRRAACNTSGRRGDRSGLNGRRPTTERPAIFHVRTVKEQTCLLTREHKPPSMTSGARNRTPVCPASSWRFEPERVAGGRRVPNTAHEDVRQLWDEEG